MFSQNFVGHYLQFRQIPGSQAFSVNNANAAMAALDDIGQKAQQDLAGHGLRHLVEIKAICNTETASSQAAQQEFRVSRPQKQQLFAGLKHRRVFNRFEQFPQYRLVIETSLVRQWKRPRSLMHESVI